MPAKLTRVMAVMVIAALSYAQFGFFLRHEAQRLAIQRSIKDRIRKGLPMEKLTPFRMTEQEWEALDWVKPKREFRLADGSMFDVVTVNVRGGEVDALCIADHEEAELFKGLKEHVRRHMEGNDAEHGPTAQVQRLITGMEAPTQDVRLRMPVRLPIVRADGSVQRTSTGYVISWSPPPKG